MNELRKHVEQCYNEARRLQEMHSRLSVNYRIIAVKARMLRESLDNLEDTGSNLWQWRVLRGSENEIT